VTDISYLDWPFLEDSHRVLAKEFSAWAKQEIAPISENEPKTDTELDQFALELVRRLAEGGWLKYCVISPWGGHYEKLDVRALCLMRETLAQHCGMADFSFVMQGLGTGPISLFGTDEMKKKYLPDVSKGKRIAAFALSEPESGSDVAALATTAKLDGNHYILNGEKTLISNGGLAHQYIVFAKTGELPGAKGISAFVVEAGIPGFQVSERFSVISPHPLGRLKFDNCRVLQWELPLLALRDARTLKLLLNQNDAYHSESTYANTSLFKKKLLTCLLKLTQPHC